jgi:hypothetical protein
VKADTTIQRNLREIRRAIDASDDVVFKRIAYSIETAVRWAREDVRDWPGLVAEAQAQTECLNIELKMRAEGGK